MSPVAPSRRRALRGTRGSWGSPGHSLIGGGMPTGPGDPQMKRTGGVDPVRSAVMLRNLFLLLGIVFAVGASLVSDSLTLSLEAGAAAAAFLSLAGLVALAARMPSLPPFVLPPRSAWQDRVHRSLIGDRLARLEVLESLDRIHGEGALEGSPLLRDRREELSSLNRSRFHDFLRSEIQRAEDLG